MVGKVDKGGKHRARFPDCCGLILGQLWNTGARARARLGGELRERDLCEDFRDETCNGEHKARVD